MSSGMGVSFKNYIQVDFYWDTMAPTHFCNGAGCERLFARLLPIGGLLDCQLGFI